MTDETGAGIDLNLLFASQFHELKNELGRLALSLDEVAGDHPDLAAPLKGPRMSTRKIIERLVQVLTLYKDREGQLPLNVEAHVPAAFVEELAAEAASLGGEHLQITLHCEDAPPFWFFDRHLTAVAMMNAVHNALEFADKAIEIGAKMENGGLCLYVSDDSSGYPGHILDNQGNTPGLSSSGTGMGLYFSQTIARAHNNQGRSGFLRLENSPGARFHLWLP
jgi:signal transduction histidine kinase